MSEIIQAAIFLDRDGVINANRADHVKSWAEFEFLPGSLRALQILAQLQWPLVVVSNQAAIGRGLITHQTVNDIHRRMALAVEKAGGRIDEVLYCPHRPDEMCSCRKPKAGMLVQAAQDMQLDLARCIMVGDAMTDIAAAQAVGVYPVLVKTGRGVEQLAQSESQRLSGVYVAEDLLNAATWIVQQAAEGRFARAHSGWNDSEITRRQMAVS